jgi:predicted AlkP superfamily pyrophosphatase or phosphodiesterase
LRQFIDGLERLGIRDTTNLIVVSDHGMAEVGRSQAIDLKGLLSGRWSFGGPDLWLDLP